MSFYLSHLSMNITDIKVLLPIHQFERKKICWMINTLLNPRSSQVIIGGNLLAISIERGTLIFAFLRFDMINKQFQLYLRKADITNSTIRLSNKIILLLWIQLNLAKAKGMYKNMNFTVKWNTKMFLKNRYKIQVCGSLIIKRILIYFHRPNIDDI